MDKNSFFPEFNDLIRLNDEEMGDNNLIDRIFSQQAESADIFGDIAQRIRDAFTPPEGEGEGDGDSYNSDDDSSASGNDDEFNLGGDDNTSDETDPLADNNSNDESSEENPDEGTDDTNEENPDENSTDESTDDTTSDDGIVDDTGLGNLPEI